MKRIVYILLIIATFAGQAFAASPNATPLLNMYAKRGYYTEKYTVLRADTSCRHGKYTLTYKNKPIEKGQYTNGKKTGIWIYYNLNEQVELKYDYDEQRPTFITKHIGKRYTDNTYPCLFLGSPLVPHHFILRNIDFPLEEAENYKENSVVLTLEIDTLGRMTSYQLTQESNKAFNDMVLQAAAKIPGNWEWVPARQNGRKVNSEYNISIIFESVKK